MKTNRKIIGTDTSLSVCKEEGYLMLEKDGKFNPYQSYRVFAYLPDYVVAEQYSNESDKKKAIEIKKLHVDTMISLENVMELYMKHEKAINNFIGMEHSKDLATYDYYSFLFLTDSVNAYCGIN